MRRLLMVLVIFLSLGMVAADEKAGEHTKIPEEYEHMKNPMANMMSEAAEKGKSIYAANCASCHGTATTPAI